ncbi:hypothetical protein HLB44_08420 [Aquincola sp. S2]|uniref:EexN family lipoprotein n=1 Tax=Pseudaquabacterium terrae TaxID=2732868 RepID=A0ABX2EEG0_9BURK|nr:hypothetical protein [Aquabacterium terrae]NRF67003.1 hypothetical protein [Aquabacterium terrae]
MKTRLLLSLAALGLLGAGCSTSHWYNQVQGAQYDKCESLANTEDRRRCKEATRPDADKYAKERDASRGTAKP